MEQAGGRAVLTEPGLPSGSDRIWAALGKADPDGRHDVVINLQGDLPALDPEQIKTVAQALEKSGADIATLAAPIDNHADEINPAVVKAVVAWQPDGRLGYVQQVSDRPEQVAPIDTQYYGTGAFLLAATAIADLAPAR